jgi:membrane-associated protease RseP (regulator of RpoE activity)
MSGIQLSIARFPVLIRTEFFIGAVLLGAGRLTEPVLLAWWVLAVGLFVTLHELGHAVMFRVFGHHPRIELQAFGGVTSGTPGMPLTPFQDVIVSLAGPFAGILFGSTVWALTHFTGFDPPSPLVEQIIQDILWINIGWGVINLLPMLPLDGGRVLAASMRWLFRERGQKIAFFVSLVMSVAILAFALYSGQTWIAILCAMFAFANLQGLRAS